MALKIYRKEVNSGNRRRIKSEIEFLKYAEETGCKQTPRLIDYNKEENWSMIEWIEGQRPNKIDIDVLKEMTNFIQELNQRESIQKKNLGYASEAIKLRRISKYNYEKNRKSQADKTKDTD